MRCLEKTLSNRIVAAPLFTLTRVVVLVLVVFVAALFAIRPSCAAEVFFMDHDTFSGHYTGAVGPLVFSGDIESGDYDLLLDKIAHNEERFLVHNKIFISAERGDVGETLRIAKLLNELHSEVLIGPFTGRCVGVCFLIFAGANQRATDGSSLLGISPLSGVDGYLADEAIPVSLATKLRDQGGQIYWLTAEDEQLLGSRSPAFIQYLKAKCAWDDALEHAALSGDKAFSPADAQWACRARVIRVDARAALRAALAARVPKP